MHQQPQPAYVPNQSPYGPPTGFPPGPPPRDSRPWHRRHRKLVIAGGALGVLLVIGGIGNAVSGSKPAAAVSPASTVTKTVTATAVVTKTVTAKATVRVTVTATAAAPASAAPAPAPAPASSSPAGSSGTVATFSGSGIKNTPQFTVSDTWELEYSYDCSDDGGSGNFIVDEDGGSDLNGAGVNELGAGGSSSTMVYGDAGTHYLSINSECSWTVKVVDES